MPDEAEVKNEPVKVPVELGEAEGEPEIKIPARRRRASDDEADEGADEFHDAENPEETGACSVNPCISRVRDSTANDFNEDLRTLCR